VLINDSGSSQAAHNTTVSARVSGILKSGTEHKSHKGFLRLLTAKMKAKAWRR